MSDPVIYSAERVRRIRIALGVATVLGMLCGMFAVLIATAADNRDDTVIAVVLGIIAAATILWTVVTWRLLENPTRVAKRSVILTGVLLILFSPLTFSLFGIGLMFVVLGMVMVFLALSSDEGAGA